jgi:hypothetical protein
MTLPAGSTSVKVMNIAKPVGKQQMVQNSYSFQNGTTAYSFFAYSYSNHAEGTPEEVSRTIASEILNPGFSANFSNSHMGTLSAAASELEGTTIKGKTTFLKTRMAFSDDRKRAWMAIAVAPDRQSFPAGQADEFMDSIQVNSR